MFTIEFVRGFYCVWFATEAKYLKLKFTTQAAAQKYAEILVGSWSTNPTSRQTDLRTRFVYRSSECVPAQTR